MIPLIFALSSSDLGVSSSLLTSILVGSAVILIGAPLFLVSKSRAGNKNSFADY